MRNLMAKSGIATVILCVILALVQGIIALARNRNERRINQPHIARDRIRPTDIRRDNYVPTDLILTNLNKLPKK